MGVTENLFGGLIVAIPTVNILPIMSQELIDHTGIPHEIISKIKYSPHVRVYASRKSDQSVNTGWHLVPTIESVATIEWFSSDHGAWGGCPSGRQWALICATAKRSEEFIRSRMGQDEIISELWCTARRILPSLFDIQEADVVHLVCWENAIPVLGSGCCKSMRDYQPKQPVAFAGDWSVQPCVEGAIR